MTVLETIISRRREVILVAIGSIVVTFSSTSSAAEYTWLPTGGGNMDWNNDDNWSQSPDAGYPNAPGVVVHLNNDITGNPNLRLNQDTTIGVLNVGDPSGGNGFGIQPGVDGSRLIFEGVNAAINVRSDGTAEPNNTISAPIALKSDLSINFGTPTSSTAQDLTLSGGLSTNSGVATTDYNVTVTGGLVGELQLNLSGDLSGDGTFTTNSSSTVSINGVKSFTGTFIVNAYASGSNQGGITLTDGSLMNAANLVINGAHSGTGNTNGNLGGYVHIGTGGNRAPRTEQALPTERITFNGGYLNNGSSPTYTGEEDREYPYTDYTQIDNVDVIDFNSGSAYVNITASDTNAGTLLHANTIERKQGASVFYRHNAPKPQIGDPELESTAEFHADNADSLIVGQSATSGTSMRIIPWMASSTNVSNLGLGGFATYDPEEGFRVLRSGEYTGTAAADVNLNVNEVGALNEDLSINSLKQNNSNRTSVIGAGRILTVQSGGVMFTGTNNHFGAAGDANGNAGVLNFGDVEGIVWTAGTNVNGIGAAITGVGGLTKAGTGTLVLTGDNNITGDTHVGGGILQVGDGVYNSSIGDGDAVVHNGALLDIRVAGAGFDDEIDVINDLSALRLLADGVLNGRISVADGIETVGALIVGGQSLAAGYYGSTTAASLYDGLYAVNSSGELDSFFVGNGLIHVVPEPSAAGLLALAGLMGLRRRKRG